MNELALFAGAGGGLLASKLLGWNTVAAVEIGRYQQQCLLARQRDGFLEPFPIWDDIKTFDGTSWRGAVDVLSGGFPCQDISVAGAGKGLVAGTRSSLWFEYQRIIDEVRPEFVFAENSPLLRHRGLDTILEGLASLGYHARWCVLGGWHIGAPHKRDRMWVLAYPKHLRRVWPPQSGGFDKAVHGISPWAEISCQLEGSRAPLLLPGEPPRPGAVRIGLGPWGAEPGLDRVVNGVADRVDRLEAVGNGQIPLVAATAFRVLSQGLL